MRRSAVVTGGAGFIGSHLVDALVEEGWRVTVLDDLSTGDPQRVPDRAYLVPLDVCDRQRLEVIIEGTQPEAIFHLAAQSQVRASLREPGRGCRVNVEGTVNVLRAAERLDVPIVFTSTGGALYGDDAPLPTPESHPTAPLSPYGASKLAAEAYVATSTRRSGLPHAVCRLGNVYGARQDGGGEGGVVAIFIERLRRGEAPVAYGHGEPTRDFVHVGDVVAALLAARGHAGTFNIATGRATSVAALLTMLQQLAPRPVAARMAPLRRGELMHSCLDPCRARDQLGWEAAIALDDGLRVTYAEIAGGRERAEPCAA